MAQEAVSGSVLDSGSKGIMLMNRIGPSSAELYIANADGSGERKLLQDSVFEHNACFTSDGKQCAVHVRAQWVGSVGPLPRPS